jgi:phage terminase large subunit-like protein
LDSKLPSNVFSTKQRPDQKIDTAIALMMAIRRAMLNEDAHIDLNGFLSRPLTGSPLGGAEGQS